MEIRNCKFKFECPKKWEDLEKLGVGSPGVRYCNHCEENVHRCKTNKALREAIQNNWCVAIEVKNIEGGIEHRVGMMEEPPFDIGVNEDFYDK